MKLVKISLMILVVLSLTACARSFAYRFADTYLMWQARSYVTLDRTQRSELKDHINEFLQWHAEHEMPYYDELLADLQADVSAQTLNGERYNFYQQQAEARWLILREALLPIALQVLPQLSDEQTEQLIESLAERIQERADTFAGQTDEERREEGAESFHKQLDKWLGDVTDEQQAVVTGWASEMPDMTTHWIEYRVRWAEAFRNALSLRHDQGAFENALTALFLAPENLRPEALQRQSKKAELIGRRSILGITETLSDKQRQHFVEEIENLRGDLASMAATRDVTLSPVAP